jgi:hypothetical protein
MILTFNLKITEIEFISSDFMVKVMHKETNDGKAIIQMIWIYLRKRLLFPFDIL